MPNSETAYLSARVATQLKTVSNNWLPARGMKVQDLLYQLMADYVAKENRLAPIATDILRRLRQHQTSMAAQGLKIFTCSVR